MDKAKQTVNFAKTSYEAAGSLSLSAETVLVSRRLTELATVTASWTNGPSCKKNPLRRFFSLLGPGLITGAADNDPSGIVTYSIAGAQLGTSVLWTAFITWPLMAGIQFMCARIGMVTGRGLAGALRQICPRWFLFVAATALLSANIITIGADLAGMSDAGTMLTGINSHALTIFFGVGIALATIYFRYYQIAFVFEMANTGSVRLRYYGVYPQTKLGKCFV